MLKKQVPIGRTLLCVLLCVVFTALTTYQFSYYYSRYHADARYQEELATSLVTLKEKETELTNLRAAVAAAQEEVGALTDRLVRITGSKDGTAEDCLRRLVGISLARKHAGTGVSAEYLNEEVDRYMDNYAADYLAVAEQLLFIDYLYRTNYLGEAPTAEEMQEAVLEGYIAATGDAYSRYFTPEEYDTYRNQLTSTLCGIGALTTLDSTGNGLLVLHTYKNSPAADAGINTGDLILEVDGRTVASLGYEGAVAALTGKAGEPVDLQVRCGTVIRSIRVARTQIEVETVLSCVYTHKQQKVGYIRITTFSQTTPAQFETALAEMQEAGVGTLIFDVRDNTGGLLTAIVSVLERILPTGAPLVNYEFANPHMQMATDYAQNDDHIDLPMYVLQNGKTASAAELFSAALQINGVATLVGEQTYGKGKMQTAQRLADGSYIKLTVARYGPGEGQHYDGVGVFPDEGHTVTPAKGYENTLIYLLPYAKDHALHHALDAACT